MGTVAIDLSANTRLRSVALCGRFGNSEMLESVIPTLRSITSDRVEIVSLGTCIVIDDDEVRVACSALDQALAEGPSNNALRRVEVLGWSIYFHPELHQVTLASDAVIKDYLRQAFTKCHALGILYYDDRSVPL